MTGSFDFLDPNTVIHAVEQAYGLTLDGTLQPYPSYINRVYGLRDEEGASFVVKFYRPGRWSREAVLDEHRFLLDCAEAEIPVVAPLDRPGGGTLAEAVVEEEEEEEEEDEEHHVHLALFPRRGGRSFDAEREEDWLRLGSMIARCHSVGRLREAPHRAVCRPEDLTAGFIRELLNEGVVHPDCREEFEMVYRETLEMITPLFSGVPLQRVHGDCHRGNILDRPGEGLLLIDFDDMMNAPPVQDIWLLLPGRAADCPRELALLLEGYETFLDFDRVTLRLIEPLRFMRMVYFLAWRARQRHDLWFAREFPDWGGKAFWTKETEDLRDQLRVIRQSPEPG
jgi:Ser/Thr protein kinase RdoA (MazF antagonist)